MHAAMTAMIAKAARKPRGLHFPSRAAISAGKPKMLAPTMVRSEEHTSELQSHHDLVCRLLLEKKNPRDQSLILKLNLSWTKYFPASSSHPWQGSSLLPTLLADGYARAHLLPADNSTVVTNPLQ